VIEPRRLRDLPAGRYLVEPVDDEAPTLTPNEEAGIEKALESYSHGRVIDAKRARAISGAAARSPTSGSLRPNDQIDVTVEYLQQCQYLVDGLAVIRLIEQAIQLRRRGPEPTNDLALG
jgi:hypothetical protein